MAALSGLLACLKSWPWPMISGFFGAAAFSVVTYTQIVRPRIRRWRLRKPFRASFVIPGDQKHIVKELVVPTNSEISIEIAVVPKLHFVQQEIYFGCEQGSVDEKPCPFEYFSSFVRQGVRGAGKPDKEHPSHYIDEDGLYHVRETYAYVNDARRIGFKILTKKKGVYPMQVFVVTEEVRGKTYDLSIRVEEEPSTKMRCIAHRNCVISPVSKG